jgi:putative heme-binding domain-containing protein
MRMHGALYVVDKLDEYLANPESYLAKNPVKIDDPLLKDRRPRTEWKYEELATEVETMTAGRNYANGRAMFKVGTCIACHKMEGEGNDFAPDLSKLDLKLKSTDILKDIIDPSFRINDKYETWTIETKAGKQHTGVILSETGKELRLIENPLVKAEPITLQVSDIEKRAKSPVSIMPKGLLDKLTREEILDLIAYITSRGDRHHPIFRAEDKHGHEH